MMSRAVRWLLPLLLVSSPAWSARADDISSGARAHFKAGVAFLEDPEGQRFEDAYREFKTAYALSNSPKVLGNLGLCAMKLERDGEAIDAYTRYLLEVPDIDPVERAQISRDLQTLKAGVVSATIEVSVPHATVLDTRLPVIGSPISNYYAITQATTALRLRPGHHVIRVRTNGQDSPAWEFTAEASAGVTHTFAALAPQPTLAPAGLAPSGGSKVGPILLVGTGVAALAVGAVLGAATLGKVHTVENECPQNVCPQAVMSGDLSTARDYVRATDFVLLGGGLLTVGGVLWYVLASPHEGESPHALGPSATGGCNTGGCYGKVSVRF